MSVYTNVSGKLTDEKYRQGKQKK